MYKSIFPFFLIIVFSCSTWAQVDKYPDTGRVINDTIYNVQDSSVFEAVKMSYYVAFDSYLYSYLEITDSVSCFIDFISASGFFNDDFVQYTRKMQCCTRILQSDSTVTLLVGDGNIAITLSSSVSCNPSVEGSYNRAMVKIFDSKGKLSNKKHIYNAFIKQRQAFYHKYKGREGQFKHYYSEETNSKRLVVVIYRFDYDTGLSLATGCLCFHKLQQNDYTESLLEFVNLFCRKHHLSRIFFSGLLSNEWHYSSHKNDP